MNDFTSTRAVLVTHRSAPAHGDDIRLYFINKKCAKFWFIAHEFAQLTTRRTYIETFTHGKLTSKVYGPDFHFLPEQLVYLKDIFTTIWLLLNQVRRSDIYIGASAFDTLPGIICQSLINLKSVIFLTIDFVPQRFSTHLLNKIYIFIDKFCITHAAQTWNPSPRMAEGREKVWGYPTSYRAKQTTVPFGIWTQNFPKPQARVKNPLIIFSGHLIPKQGVQLAILSLPKIITSIPNIRLVVIGQGDYRLELEKLAKQLKVTDHVKFLGYVDPPTQSRLLSTAWLGLATFDPQLDTFSYYADPGKIKTYLGHGLPVITTDVPYIARIIDQNRAGTIVKYDPHNFTDAVVKLLKNPSLLRQYSQHALQLAATYDWNRTLDAQLLPLL